MDQFFIVVLGIASAFTYNSPQAQVRRFGPLVSLLVQPFWFYATSKAGQHGMFFLTMFFTAMAIRGCWHCWLQPYLAQHRQAA